MSLPSATAYHRLPFRAVNQLLRWLWPLGVGKADFTEANLIRAARETTGLEDFGDERFREPLGILLHALDTEADLNPLGRYLQRQSVLRILKHLLWLNELLKKHPEILARKLPPPVVVVGLARSGTTRLHRLLAADKRFLHLEAWESVNPVPWPESFHAGPDPRMTSIEKALKAVLYLSPQIAQVHPLGAHEVEEEVGLIQHAISTQLFEVMAKVPSFSRWLIDNDQTRAYELMVTLLKVVSWFRKDPEDKPWVLKTPQHMQDLDALLNVFPDARLVFSHRDPVKAVGSACSMTWNSIVRDTDNVTPEWVGSVWFPKTVQMVEKTLRVRDERVAEGQGIDVYYANINADWRAELGRVYDWLGMPLTEEAEQSMREWVATNAQHKHGAHKYSLADFGLDKQTVDAELMFYRERFNIPYE